MNTPLLAFVYDRKKKATSTKEAPVELRITFNRRQKYMATGVRLLPKHWRNGHVVNRMDATEMQHTLDTLMTRVRTVVNAQLDTGTISLDEIPSQLQRMMEDRRSFLDFCADRVEVRKYGKAEDTAERYDRFLKWFRSWGKIIYFSDVTDRNIMAMDRALHERGMKTYSVWNNYHRFLNSFIIDAVDEGLLRRNPYKHVRIDKDKSTGGIGKYLTPEEFRRLERFQPPTQCLERVRDLFVFQTYTCLAYTDLAAFDPHLIYNVGDKPVYTANRGKTQQEFTLMLLQPAMAILEKYNNRLPLLSNVKYNEYLKVLAMMAKIHKPISSHWARHTGATLLLNEGGMDMEVVAKILGHSSTKITRQVYAKLLDETVVDAMSGYEGQLRHTKETKSKAPRHSD